MREFLDKIIPQLKRPRGRLLVIAYLVTALSIALAMTMLAIGYDKSALTSVIAYASFALAAITLGYSVYTVVIYAPGLKAKTIAFLKSKPFTERVLTNYGFRTVVTASLSFLMSIGYAAFNAYLGISARSIWFGALAAYYILLALMRGGLLLYHKNKNKDDFESEERIRVRKYRNTGVVLLLLNFALSSAIAQMIFDDRGFSYPGWIIYAFAAYAFAKVAMAIVSAYRATKEEDLTLRAIRNIGLVDAAVSILALQTALLTTFGSEVDNISTFNTLTGIAVSSFAVYISIYVIVKGNKLMKAMKTNGKG